MIDKHKKLQDANLETSLHFDKSLAKKLESCNKKHLKRNREDTKMKQSLLIL